MEGWDGPPGGRGKAGSQAERQIGRKPEHLHVLTRTPVRVCAQPRPSFDLISRSINCGSSAESGEGVVLV